MSPKVADRGRWIGLAMCPAAQLEPKSSAKAQIDADDPNRKSPLVPGYCHAFDKCRMRIHKSERMAEKGKRDVNLNSSWLWSCECRSSRLLLFLSMVT
jgi:hypothetical protein